jgi:hypothetical protein
MEKANRWKGKSIGMPKKGISYCISLISVGI